MQLPGYEFAEKIGEGGMAAVFKGRQLSLARPVAIKMLNQQMRQHGQVREAFERESLIIARLSHPNIIQVIDRGVTAQGTPYFIMEYVDGVDLAKLIHSRELPFKRKLEICLQICKALAYAHKNAVIHRDIKPGNVIVDTEYHVKVLDFGIAQFYGVERRETEHPKGKKNREKKNRAKKRKDGENAREQGADGEQDIMGTLTYMAPELARAASQATFKSDIYSLGVILYELLTGLLPNHLAPSRALFPSEVPQALIDLVMECLALQADKRPTTVTDVHDRLLLVLQGAHLNDQQVKRAGEGIDKKTFKLLDILSENRFGAVYLFMEKHSGRQLVVKKSVGNYQGYSVCLRLAGLEHPHIARVHGASKNDRAFIVVMEYLKAGSLQDRLIRSYSIDEFLRIARQICAGLAFAHAHGIVHGNLRASNLLFDAQGNVCITDFGLPAHYRDEPAPLSLDSDKKRNWYSLPDEPRSPRADIFACGVIFYRMLIGELPRWHQSRLERGRAFKRLPEALQRLLVQMLNTNRQRRPRDVNQVALALEELNDVMPTVVVSVGPRATPQVEADPVTRKKEILLLLLLVLFFLILVDTGAVVLYSQGHLDLAVLKVWFISLFERR